MTNIHFVSPEERFDKYQIINNEQYANYLTQFLISKSSSGYVLNLNAEWGAGKTTFLQCWYNELKNKHPIVYFDAWKSDFTKDPMLALMDAFHQQLITPLSENKELVKQFFSKGSHFLRTTMPSLLVGYLKRQGGINDDDSLLTSASEEFGIAESDLSDALKETMKSMLAQKNRVEGIAEFQNVLTQMSKDYLEVFTHKNKPVFILIDELDRCRPTYAIEIIECVKHFFNTENFIFILATDTNQLQHSIKSVYGTNFDSLTYLSRFFDNSATLPAPNRKKFVETSLLKQLDGQLIHPIVIDFIDAIFEWHGTSSLREIKKILNVVEVAKSQKKGYCIIVLIVLSLLKRCYPEHYHALRKSGTPPYIGRHGSRTNEQIQGKNLPFDFTNVHRDNAEIILCMAAVGSWERYEPKKIDFYKGMNVQGMTVENVSAAIILESLSNTDSVTATHREHYSLIEFAGFFQG